MSKKLQLHIPLPCHEDWNDMTPVDKGKFCASCQKAVIDFTYMSDEEIITYFKKPATSSVCGRFDEKQLNREIQMPRKTLPWIKYFFQFALPAFLISMKADAQRKKVGKVASVCVSEVKGEPSARLIENVIFAPDEIKGRVVDEEGIGIVQATVMIKGTRHGVATDTGGYFSIKFEDPDYFITLVISSIGFETFEKTVNVGEYTPQTIITMKLQSHLLGEVVIASSTAIKGRLRSVYKGTAITCTKDSVATSLIRNIKDSIIAPFLKFSVYPNPVIAGQSITIANKKLPDDNYKIEIINLAGQIVHQQQSLINGKQKINLKSPFVAAGTYFLKLTGEKSSKTYSEKIIIQ